MEHHIKKKVTKMQLSKIWANARDLGMTGESKFQLYGLASQEAGRYIESFSDEIDGLKYDEAWKLIQKLEKLNSPIKKKSNIIHLATINQKKKVQDLAQEINKGSKKIDPSNVTKRMFNRELNQLTLEQMQSVIEALKSILKRFNKKKNETQNANKS